MKVRKGGGDKKEPEGKKQGKPVWPEYEYPRRGAPTPSSTANAMACSTRLWSSQ
ncbi:unnamed protein product [Tetraodon nigroviridis]|uniref:(spotted green pufferfish) hypothetical protein n=1 Tax=Tetraodon nigroviridis TaxID=99883 RepID=Q4RE33_TETNG|nr:unnamed protein product [Tetraodon nigroviridis]